MVYCLGEVEMVYRLLAGGKSKQWLPEGNPFVIMRDVPPGYPSLLRPENRKNSSPEEMEKSLGHLSARLTAGEMDWWKTFIAGEKKERDVGGNDGRRLPRSWGVIQFQLPVLHACRRPG